MTPVQKLSHDDSHDYVTRAQMAKAFEDYDDTQKPYRAEFAKTLAELKELGSETDRKQASITEKLDSLLSTRNDEAIRSDERKIMLQRILWVSSSAPFLLVLHYFARYVGIHLP